MGIIWTVRENLQNRTRSRTRNTCAASGVRFMMDIIPAGQAIETVTPYYRSYFLIMTYAVIEALAFTGVGIYIFSKKNIN